LSLKLLWQNACIAFRFGRVRGLLMPETLR